MSVHSSPIRRLAHGLCLAAGLVVTSAASAQAQTQVFTSNNQVDTWDPIYPASVDSNWATTVCTRTPAVGRGANWQNPHKASSFGTWAHPWQRDDSAGFSAPWINAWTDIDSRGDGGHSWTRYSTTVSGTGEFVLNLLADNCSWVYIDGALVGFQGENRNPTTYPVTLAGTHTLEFIIFDGGGAAGGMYRLETNTSTVFPDTDNDGLTDPEEHLHGTNKNNRDTDGDGVSDGDEVAAGTNPLVVNVPPDTTTPIITSTVTGVLNGDWYSSDVTVDWTVTDPESPITSAPCTSSVVVTDTDGTTFTCTATSAGGETTQSVTIKRDTTKPVIVPTVTGTESNGWYTSNVSVSWSVTDSLSPFTSSGCGTTTVTTDTAGTTFTCKATSAGGPSSQSVTIKRDTTTPEIVPTVTGTESNGWYTSDVSISWSVTDSLSPLTSNGCSATSVESDTNGSTFTCTATSAPGTSSKSVTIKRDTTGPVISSLTTNAPSLWPPNHTMQAIRVTPTTSDAGSGGVVCSITGVTSNEGVNQHEPDVQITGPLTVNLRAERNGNNTARVYSIQVSCKDATNNKSEGTTTVVVPHDQGKKK